MTLDDLRAEAHTLAKDIHELDVDRLAAEARFSERLAVLSGRANDLAVKLQNYQPTEPPTPAVKVRFAQHIYNNNQPIDFAAFDLYDVQRGFITADGPIVPRAEFYLYATIVRRPSDPQGLTQFLRPSLVPDSWCAHTPSGQIVTRTRGEGPENLINIAVAQWRALAIPNIVEQVVHLGAAGLYVDEVDAWWRYAWPMIPGTGAKEFKTESYWRSMWLKFLTELADALHAKGKKLWANLGADYDFADPWQLAVVDIVDAVNIEFFVGREGVGMQPATVDSAWLEQTNFVLAVERRGKPVHVHCSSNTQKVVDYAFCSWLAHTAFLGSFSASRDYGGTIGLPDGTLWTRAQSLGRPLAGATQNGPVWSRRFEHGTVHVNPTNTPDVALAATSGAIELD